MGKTLSNKYLKTLNNPYFTGICLFIITLLIGLFTYKDYGMAWDEPDQRAPGVQSYNYIFNGNQELFQKKSDHHGAGFEIPLVIIEKSLNITDPKAIYEMRHLVTHLFFLVSLLFGYFLFYRLFKNNLIASIGYLLLAFSPRIYAHSFFNTKDLPFLCMFTIIFAVSEYAFDKKNKLSLFFILGLLCGYATSIRIMGVMIGGFIIAFLLLDLFFNIKDKEKPTKTVLKILLFIIGFFALLLLGWPYLWHNPVKNFADSFASFSHYEWNGPVLLNGKFEKATKLPWFYFPVWFFITNPILWLIAGFTGIVIVILAFIKKPLEYIKNTTNRNFIFYLACFFAPIFAVIVLHSVIYDDWRHLYFVYPSFVLLALYAINFFMQKKFKWVLVSLCALQFISIAWFMVRNHPLNHIYFNELVSHEEDSLRHNYEMDYWGLSMKQGLEYIAANDTSKHIKIASDFALTPIRNNIQMLPMQDRVRFDTIGWQKADYFMTNFRCHPEDYPPNSSITIDYTLSVLNSQILCIFKMHNSKK